MFSIVIIVVVLSTSYISFKSLESAVIDSQLLQMGHEVEVQANFIDNLNARASEDLLFAIKNPVFVKYFELPDTQAGNIYKNDVLQFTPQQRTVKNELDQWIYNFQDKFSVDETCLIDRTGQEHTRLVMKKIAPDRDLSHEESSTPFFKPSFQKNSDEVYLQYPYVSPDTERWVFAYTTPIVLNDGSKPAFYHFEIPLKFFQDITKVDQGRVYVVDSAGYLVADSGHVYNQSLNSAPFGQSPKDFFPSISTISTSSEFTEDIRNILASDNNSTNTGHVTYSGEDGELHYIVFKRLPMFGWILAYEKPYSLMMSGNYSLHNLAVILFVISLGIIAAGLIAIYVLSDRITRPIIDFARECRNQDVSNLQIINPMGTDKEINQVIYAFNEMIERVNAIEKQKEEFASMVTHELKSPLTPIIGWCQTLKNPKLIGQLNSKQLNAVDIIQKNAKRLLQLVGDILDVQKLDLNRMKFDSQPIDVDDLLNYMHNNLQNIMAQKNINHINSTKEQLTIRSDRNRIEQVLNNLILNAVDFVPSESGKIEYGAQSKGDEILFYVKDNGIGIPPEKQKNLFRKFYQIDTSVTRKHGGSGLGLALSKGIIESLGGKIWVESELGKGASFYFTIPIDRTKTAKSEKVIDVKDQRGI
ncbi:MAG TPA: sensor histidine kinase [Nitrososphaeraceae archaeon]|nr:sensor histidine kinase [Nitrososphaeraceae archaeon]